MTLAALRSLDGQTSPTVEREPDAGNRCVTERMAEGSTPRVLIAAVFLLATGCTADPDADEVGSEDLRAMRAMVDLSCKLDVERLVVSAVPAIPRESDLHDTDNRNVQFGIDFDRRLARDARWPQGQICPAVRVVSDSAIATALANETGFPGSWENFIATFGGARAVMRISLPVFSPDGNHAVIYTSSNCPYTCGEGFYHELEKTYEGWKIVSSRNVWTR